MFIQTINLFLITYQVTAISSHFSLRQQGNTDMCKSHIQGPVPEMLLTESEWLQSPFCTRPTSITHTGAAVTAQGPQQVYLMMDGWCTRNTPNMPDHGQREEGINRQDGRIGHTTADNTLMILSSGSIQETLDVFSIQTVILNMHL